jgi:hypothetical protein
MGDPTEKGAFPIVCEWVTSSQNHHLSFLYLGLLY